MDKQCSDRHPCESLGSSLTFRARPRRVVDFDCVQAIPNKYFRRRHSAETVRRAPSNTTPGTSTAGNRGPSGAPVIDATRALHTDTTADVDTTFRERQTRSAFSIPSSNSAPRNAVKPIRASYHERAIEARASDSPG